jgi:arylsulfatase A-like enzyme
VDARPVDLNRWHGLKGDESDALWRPRFEQYLRNRSDFQTEEDWFAPRVTQEAIRWLDDVVRRKGVKDRLFLWVDYFDPHEPWDPPEPYWSMYRDPTYRGQDIIDPVAGSVSGYLTPEEVGRVKSLYAGEVTFVDKWAGELLNALREYDLYEDSLILWLSDHGEPFGEHGIIRKARPWNYEELVRIPWVMKLPSSLEVRAPSLVNALVQPTDVMPTILDALGVPTPLPLIYRAPQTTGTFPQDMSVSQKGIVMHGHSLLPLLRGEVERVRDFACTGHYRQTWSIQNAEWRYLLFIDGSKPSELYHRPDDPYDQRNVIDAHREVADALELELRRWVANLARL